MDSPHSPQPLPPHRAAHNRNRPITPRPSRRPFRAHQSPHTLLVVCRCHPCVRPLLRSDRHRCESSVPESYCAVQTLSTATSPDPTPPADDPPTAASQQAYQYWARSPPPRAGCHQPHRSSCYAQTVTNPRRHQPRTGHRVSTDHVVQHQHPATTSRMMYRRRRATSARNHRSGRTNPVPARTHHLRTRPTTALRRCPVQTASITEHPTHSATSPVSDTPRSISDIHPNPLTPHHI